MVEAAPGLHQLVQLALTRMAEGRVAEIVRQRQSLRQVLVQPQRTGDGARHLRDLDRMGEPGPVMVPLVIDENLRLVLQPTECLGVDDAVAVAGKGRAEVGAALRVHPSAGLLWQ